MANMGKLYTAQEAAGVLRCTRRALYGHIKAGTIRAAKPAGRWLISQAAIDDYVARGSNGK